MKNSLGLGCSKLSHQFTIQSAVRNLEIAYDYGIKHFDIALSYGFDTGILKKAGGINPTASIFCLIENHLDE